MGTITDILGLLTNLCEGLKYEVESIRFQNLHDIISPVPIRYGVTLKVTNTSQLQLSLAEMRLWVEGMEYRRSGWQPLLFVAGEAKTIFIPFECEETSPKKGAYKLIFKDSRGRAKTVHGRL